MQETTYGNQPHLEDALDAFLSTEPSGPATILWSSLPNGASTLAAITGLNDHLLHQCLASWFLNTIRPDRNWRLYFGNHTDAGQQMPRYDVIILADECSQPNHKASVVRQIMTWFKAQPVHTSVFCWLVPYDPDQPEASALSHFSARCA